MLSGSKSGLMSLRGADASTDERLSQPCCRRYDIVAKAKKESNEHQGCSRNISPCN